MKNDRVRAKRAQGRNRATQQKRGNEKNRSGSYGIYYAKCVERSQDVRENGKLYMYIFGLDHDDVLVYYKVPVDDTAHWRRILKCYWDIDNLNEIDTKWESAFIRCCRYNKNGSERILPVLPDRALKLINLLHRGRVIGKMTIDTLQFEDKKL